MQTSTGTKKNGTELLREAIQKLLLEGKGWAQISQLCIDMALQKSGERHKPQQARYTRH